MSQLLLLKRLLQESYPLSVDFRADYPVTQCLFFGFFYFYVLIFIFIFGLVLVGFSDVRMRLDSSGLMKSGH